jgi:uncharacterized membrane protein YqgA involved in biofilm formation
VRSGDQSCAPRAAGSSEEDVEVLRGAGTLLNVGTVLLGSGLGIALGGRLPERTRRTVTDALGLVTVVIGGLNVASGLGSADYRAAVGPSAGLLVVLGALLVGGIAGSLLRVEDRLDSSGGWLQSRLGGRAVGSSSTGSGGSSARARFVEGFVSASLLFCVGPLTVLGSLSDGLGKGIEQLALKSTLDGFAAIAFAASLGWGVAASAISVAVVQGSLTVLGGLLGDLLPAAEIAALTATGGVLLLGVGLRLLSVKAVAVGDLLPALAVAPALTALVALVR